MAKSTSTYRRLQGRRALCASCACALAHPRTAAAHGLDLLRCNMTREQLRRKVATIARLIIATSAPLAASIRMSQPRLSQGEYDAHLRPAAPSHDATARDLQRCLRQDLRDRQTGLHALRRRGQVRAAIGYRHCIHESGCSHRGGPYHSYDSSAWHQRQKCLGATKDRRHIGHDAATRRAALADVPAWHVQVTIAPTEAPIAGIC